MLKHNLLTALRHFARNKGTTAINVLCLMFGFVCFMVTYGSVESMRQSDGHHEKAARTYLVTQRSEVTDAGALTLPSTGRAYAPLLKNDYPELEYVARASRSAELAVSSDTAKGFAMTSYVDPQYLDVFDFDFVAGDRRNALRQPRSAVIHDELARQWFGTTDVVGTALVLNNRETVHITGVMKSPRQPSHMSASAASMAMHQFQLLVSIDAWKALRPQSNITEAERRTAYFGFNTYTFIVLREKSALTVEQLRAELPAFVKRHVATDLGSAELDIVPVSQLSSISADTVTRREQTGVTFVGILWATGIMALIVACLNYANLASAQASTQLKELALRRVFGATYRQVVIQTFVEALVLVLAAALLALALIPLLSDAMYLRSGTHFQDLVWNSPDFWITVSLTIVGVALLASAYPTWIAARTRPAQSLHSGRTPLFKVRALRLLVICQFVAASFLFISTRATHAHYEQSLLASATDGADPIVVITNDLKEIGVDRRQLLERLAQRPSITSVSAIETPPGRLFAPSAIVSAAADPESRRTMIIAPVVDYGFFDAMRIVLLAGRAFDRGVASDLTTGDTLGNVVVDRAFALERGWEPAGAVGKSVFVPSIENSVGRPATIIGVVEDRAQHLMKFGSAATMYRLDPERATALVVRMADGDMARGLQSIDEVWNEFAPRVALKRTFLDDTFKVYSTQINNFASTGSLLASIAFVIAATGLLGIATHAIAQRTYEIGVRKSLGASASRVLTMLLKDFAKPIVIGNLIAWPLAFGYEKIFAAMYVHSPPASIGPYVASLSLGLAVACAVVLPKAWAAARVPPAIVLRHE
jgi:putative ABC transport system permease protein